LPSTILFQFTGDPLQKHIFDFHDINDSSTENHVADHFIEAIDIYKK